MSQYVPDLLVLAALVCLSIAVALFVSPAWGFAAAGAGLLALGLLVGIRGSRS